MTPVSERSWAMASTKAKVQRDYALGTPSARSYLLTILGEFVLDQHQPIWTSAFVDSLGALGIDEKTARQTVARSASRGLLISRKIGRRTQWHLTNRAISLLDEGKERIYSFHTSRRQWDKQWVIILVAIPESRRQSRYNLRVRLGWAGFAPLSAGVWICPWTDRKEEATAVLAELSLDKVAHIFIGSLADIHTPSHLASEAWDLPGVETIYEDFLSANMDNCPESPKDTFVALTRLVNAWRRLPLLDPDLPTELLPLDWSGEKATQLFHELHDSWKPLALAWWQEACV